MKSCPRCNFVFPDFHHVCDFDGTELIPDPDRPLLAPPRSSFFRRALKSPMLTSLVILAVFSSVVLFGYFKSVPEAVPPVKYRFPSLLLRSSAPLARAPGQSPAQIKIPVPPHVVRMSRSSKPVLASHRRPATTSRAVARAHQPASITSKSKKPDVAQRRDFQPISPEKKATVTATSASQKPQVAQRTEPPPIPHDKEPKLTAMLKTTWRVLKRPFKF